jgi:2'-hydroxyisoflavone reductase
VRFLVLGGTWFVGSAVVAETARRGHDVVVFNRGRTPATVPAGVRILHGDREDQGDLARLAAEGPWDVVIDIAGSVPTVVRDSVHALASSVGRYVLISTISVYRDWPYVVPIREDSPLFAGDPDYDPGTREWDPDAYGPLKAGCELAVVRGVGLSRATILRPHVILGPGEYVGRLPWWLERMRRGGRVIAPGPDRAIQPIDVRDLATFTVGLAEQDAVGAYNVAAPTGRDTFGGMLDACRNATGSDAVVEWVDERFLVDRGVRQWTELPLWRAVPTAWGMDTSRAQAARLQCRPLANTVLDTWAWLRAGGRMVEHERRDEHGMDPRREADLLREWNSARSAWSP